jgi:hypothetical protein
LDATLPCLREALNSEEVRVNVNGSAKGFRVLELRGGGVATVMALIDNPCSYPMDAQKQWLNYLYTKMSVMRVSNTTVLLPQRFLTTVPAIHNCPLGSKVHTG